MSMSWEQEVYMILKKHRCFSLRDAAEYIIAERKARNDGAIIHNRPEYLMTKLENYIGRIRRPHSGCPYTINRKGGSHDPYVVLDINNPDDPFTVDDIRRTSTMAGDLAHLRGELTRTENVVKEHEAKLANYETGAKAKVLLQAQIAMYRSTIIQMQYLIKDYVNGRAA